MKAYRSACITDVMNVDADWDGTEVRSTAESHVLVVEAVGKPNVCSEMSGEVCIMK